MATSPPNCIVRVMELRGTYKGGGGPDKTILHSAAQHDQSKVNILVTYIRQPDDDEFQIQEIADKLNLNYADLPDRNILDRHCLVGLRKLVKKNSIEIVHTHDDKTLLYGFFLKCFVPHLCIIHTCHSHAEYTRRDFPSFFSYAQFRLRKKFLVFLMKRHCKPIITISNDTKVRLSRTGLLKQDIAVVHNGIDVDYWKKENAETILREELNMNEGQLLVGTVARITYDKDLTTFFKTATLVAQKISNVKFVVVGDGYRDELEQAKNEVTKLNLNEIVYFTGHRNDLRNIYASFDLFLMTSRTEGLPNTLLESMALEVPVVSTEVGGVPEVIRHGEHGLLCPVGDEHCLADAVCKMLKNRKLREGMAKKSRERIENKFNFTNRIRLFEELYLYFASKGSWPVW